jgi:hypothetical protein
MDPGVRILQMFEHNFPIVCSLDNLFDKFEQVLIFDVRLEVKGLTRDHLAEVESWLE